MLDKDLQELLEHVVAPLIEADDGELYLVAAEDQTVHLHLCGRFSGCPGNGLVTEHVLRPLIISKKPEMQLQVTSGVLIPPGAERITGLA